jgi:hypothetical protein
MRGVDRLGAWWLITWRFEVVLPDDDVVVNGSAYKVLRSSMVTFAGAGGTALAAVAGKKIRVVGVNVALLVIAGSCSLSFASGAGAAQLAFSAAATDQGVVLPLESAGWMETVAGEAVSASVSATTNAIVTLFYVLI